jgi:hypothetical protein
MRATTTASPKLAGLPKKAYSSTLPAPKMASSSENRVQFSGDSWLQSSTKRRYMRRGSRSPSMLAFTLNSAGSSLDICLERNQSSPDDKQPTLNIIAEALNLSTCLDDDTDCCRAEQASFHDSDSGECNSERYNFLRTYHSKKLKHSSMQAPLLVGDSIPEGEA